MNLPSDNQVEPLGDQTSQHTMLTALLVVARSHGVHLSLESLIRRFVKTAGEVNCGVLVKIARESGLEAKAVRMNGRQLMKVGKALPAILQCRSGQALVLTGLQSATSPPVYFIEDPSQPGVAKPVDEVALSEIWDGDVVLFKRASSTDTVEEPFGFSLLYSLIRKEYRIFRDVGISALVLSVFSLAPPLIFLTIIDKILVHQRMSSFVLLTIAVFYVIVFETAFSYLRRYLVAEGSARVDARLSTYVFTRLLRLPISVFESTPTGLIAYKINETWKIRQFLTGQLFGTLLDSITLLVLLPFLFYLDAALTLFVLALSVLMFIVVIVYIKPIGKAQTRVVRAETAKNSFLIETVFGMRTVKSLAIEPRREVMWDRLSAQSVLAHRDMQHLINQPQTILAPLEKGIQLGTLVLGAYFIISAADPANAGALIAFIMLAGRATQPIIQLATLLQQLEETRGAVAEVASILNIPAEQMRSQYGLRPQFRGRITFEDVSFRYDGANSLALDRADFDIPEGSLVGIMGRSGSGKTTVTRLLQGLHQNYEGFIRIDGADMKQMDLHHLRANLGVVLQDNFLFSGSVRDNISAARPDATFEQIITAARMAGAEEFIERLPRGYDTMIAEGSSNLSGGQRQRIAIARALLTNPSVLILDEATSALDPDSEAIINNNLLTIAKGRTVLIVSHRLASLVACDQIIVMDRGRVIDIGKHHDLVERCDVYRHLWQQQNRHVTSPGGSSYGRAIPSPSSSN